MEYTIQNVSKMANISTRTLRYYDQIDLLKPAYINESGYRVYTSHNLDTLQLILLYKELDLPLEKIKQIIHSGNVSVSSLLNENYAKLLVKKERLDRVIQLVKDTIENKERNIIMMDDKKFTAFKEEIIQDNETKYGEELKELYPNEDIRMSYETIRKMSKYQLKKAEELGESIKQQLKLAIKEGIQSDSAKELVHMHKEWIMMYWGKYSVENHIGLGEMYQSDERFKAYYDKIVTGGCDFLVQCLRTYLKK